ncbi:hypothetical protein DSO57_1009105 [Entomophthora muscae]|uniref:Uncharacterized protein n=1 Tax=Entomophthora muscae TaxID=34485 RepID=A0ACC2RY19_9FUNG|nr:hypothetical protein DSO57_1009105 [Entomophthora muscae]
METTITHKPMPMSPPKLLTDHSSKLFGIVYITLSGMIDTIILTASLWSWLALILWWALPAKNLACVIPENDGLAAQAWIPDTANVSLPFSSAILLH